VSIRVLEVLATLKRAGAERVAVELARALDRTRFETAVVSLYGPFPGGLEPLLEEAGIRTWHLQKSKGFDPRMWPRLARVVREFRPDIVHTHSYVLRYAAPVARPAAIVHTVHNLAEREVDGFGRWVNRWAFRRGAAPVAAGKEIARSFRRVYGFDVTATIQNGVGLSLYRRPGSRQAWRNAHGFGEDDLLIVSVARLDPQKDPLGLIQAFARGLEQDSRSHLLLAGGGALDKAARECADRCGVSGRVHFLGVCGDVPDLLAAADLFALASRWEGSPLAVMEAMAARLPVVATAVGEIPELVATGASGILVPPGDLDGLADALGSLAHDVERRRTMGEAAGARAAGFSVEAMVQAYADLFERVKCSRSLTVAARSQTEPRASASGPSGRVVLLTTNLARGGAETHVAGLARGLKLRGWDVSVISLLEPTAFHEELEAAGVAVFSLKMRPGVASPLGFVRLLALLRRLRPHVLHSHMFHANLMARLARLFYPAPVLISTLHSIAESGRESGSIKWRDRLYRATDSLSDVTVAVCQAVAQRHSDARAVPKKRLRVIPNGVDTRRFRPDAGRRERTRREQGLGTEFAWLAVGRLMWKKGYETMLRAFAEEGRGLLLIAGSGPQERELEELAGELAVHARFLGQREDVADLMAACDGFVQSSMVEGLPLALLEAASSGLPAVVSDAGGVSEVVLDGRTGLVVPLGNPAALGAAVSRLVAMPEAQRRMLGEAAREHVVNNFDLDAVVARWEALYRELLAPWM
jgi:glycosyltransferase involved in cell wall biosynthesis